MTPSLTVPTPLLADIQAAGGAGRSAATVFAATHDPSTAWLFRSAAIELGGYAPKPDVEQRELAELHQLQTTRTDEGIQRAAQLDKTGWGPYWHDTLTTHLATTSASAADAARATRLLTDALALTNDIVQTVKGASLRPRPYVTDPTITAAVGRPGNNPSFPSGHTSAAFAAAEVLAALIPERAEEFRATAAEVGFSRMYAGMHYRSDIVSAARVGSMVGAYAVQLWLPGLQAPAAVAA